MRITILLRCVAALPVAWWAGAASAQASNRESVVWTKVIRDSHTSLQ